MFRIGHERFKLYILIFLIFTSFIQVGILWNEQYHGLPINFLMRIYKQVIPSSLIAGIDIQVEAIRPVRVVLSYDESHWIISKKTGNYDKLWEDGRRYLRLILSTKQSATRSEAFSEGLWKELVSQNGIYYEFQTGIVQSMLAWLLNVPDPVSADPPAVYKMILAPWVNMNFNQTTLYITDGFNIYTYTLSVPAGGINKDFYRKMALQFSEDKNLVSYNVIKEFSRLPLIMAPDVFFNVKTPKVISLRDLRYSEPDIIKNLVAGKTSNLEEMAKLILGSGEKDNYDIALSESPGLAEFKNLNNIYRINKDGLLEYRYLLAIDPADKGNMEQAFAVAQNFLDRIKPLMTSGDMEIIFSGYGQKNIRDSYEFTFDYRVDELPVIPVSIKDSNNKVLTNTITIRANSKRVMECWWMLKKFELAKEAVSYNIGFSELLNDLTGNYPTLKLNKSVSIKDISISYRIQGNSDQQTVEPSWTLRIDDNASGKKDIDYVLPMKAAK